MASLSHTMSQKKYSWWWDSHISPKNSRWLQENLTDMDSKVKSMIKLIEEDADSFARRAEMYYKKRPELMKLVEEFYRAYRALAERYDHATGALRQAHRTMSVAFPNQIPMMLPDDAPETFDFDTNPRTPETSTPVHAFSDVDNQHKNSSGFSLSHAAKKSGQFAEALDSLKQLNVLSGENPKITEGRARKGLNFQENMDSEQVSKYEKEIMNLKETICKLEAEKEAGQEQYQQALETLSKLEAAVSRAQEDSREHNDKASKAEAEAKALKEALLKMEAEKEASLLQYQLCLDNISSLENIISNAQKDSEILNERANKAEIEVQTVKEDIARVESEKDDVLNQYKLSLEMISDLRKNLLLAEESAQRHRERAEKAEAEVETLRQAILKLTEEKDAAALKYQQCLETISGLERKISIAHEETRRINGEMDKLETSNQSLHSELEIVLLKMTNQDQELTEKQKELGRLWTCIQEERLRFIEAETAFQTLQHLHSKAQEELRSLALELQNRTLIIREMESHKESLRDEISKIKEENKGLNELNQSSAMSMDGMQSEILSLREMNGKLGEEVELRVDQRNALQQEIYCLKQELKDLNDKQDAVIRQVNAVGLTPECIETSVKILQDDNSNLRELYEKEKTEKVTLIDKLEIFEKLLEKNSLLENSLADMSVELEAVRGKIFVLEESCESLLQEKSTLVGEKATLMTQLHLTTDNLLKLSATNTILQNSFSHAHDRLEEMKTKTSEFEDSCMLLDSQTSILISEKDVLVSEFETFQQRLKDYEKITIELEDKFFLVENEKNSALDEVQELKVSLEAEKHEHECFAEMSAKRLADLETQVHHLEEERWSTDRELQNELDKALNSQMEIVVLQSCVNELGGTNSSLLVECQKLLEASKKSEILVSKLEKENVEQKAEVKALSDKLSASRNSMHQFLMALDSIPEYGHEEKNEQEEMNIDHILKKLQDFKHSFCKSQDEKHLEAIEKSVLVTLLSEMRSEAAKIATEKSITDQELAMKSGQCLMVQCEVQKLFEMTEKLRSDVINGCQKEKELMTEIENLSQKLLVMEMAYKNVQNEKAHALDENRFLLKEVKHLKEIKHAVEEENCTISGEMFSLSLLSLILKNNAHERSLEIKEISEDIKRFQLLKTSLEKKLSIQEEKLEDLQTENQQLGETVQKSGDELQAVTCVVSQLSNEIESVKNLFHQKEMELLEAEQKLTVIEDEKSGLTMIVEDLKSKEDALQIIRNDLEKQIGKLEEDNVHLDEKNRSLGEANHSLEVELLHFHDKYETTKSREASLSSEIQERNKEIDMWETQATVFYGELHTSSIVQMLFTEKVHELIKECTSLQDETTSKDVKMEVLEKRISIVEGQNKELEARLALYGTSLNSLMDSISSLEKHTFPHAHLDKSVSEEIKDAKLANQQLAASEDNALVSDDMLNIQKLQARVKTIENVIVEMESLAMEENSSLHTKLESALRLIDEMSSESHKLAENIKQPRSEITEENGLLPKDIMLDHISETSSYGISKRRYDGSDMQIQELWETTDQDGSIDLTVGKGKNVVNGTKEHPEASKQDREYFSSNSLVEKELGVDTLEISKRFTQPQHDWNKRKVLERLNSDVQKLTNLQITVQDLRTKVESIEKSRKSKAIPESNTIKGKLNEAEAAIQKLFDFNGKLMKNIEAISSESGQKSALDSEESSSVRRKRISEQALRVSERIGRLQLEMQRIQFELLKLDDEKESKGKIRIVESKRRVLLRDYLYGGGRKIPKRKKAPFCACVEPRTKGD